MGVEDLVSIRIARYKALIHHPLITITIRVRLHVPVDITGVWTFSIKRGVWGITLDIPITQHKIDVRPKADIIIWRTNWQKNNTIVVCPGTTQHDLTNRIIRTNDGSILARRRRFWLDLAGRQNFGMRG